MLNIYTLNKKEFSIYTMVVVEEFNTYRESIYKRLITCKICVLYIFFTSVE